MALCATESGDSGSLQARCSVVCQSSFALSTCERSLLASVRLLPISLRNCQELEHLFSRQPRRHPPPHPCNYLGQKGETLLSPLDEHNRGSVQSMQMRSCKTAIHPVAPQLPHELRHASSHMLCYCTSSLIKAQATARTLDSCHAAALPRPETASNMPHSGHTTNGDRHTRKGDHHSAAQTPGALT